ncbi:hypothetical protein Ssi02_39790 [Sinosporangium siamense]|uniref:Uncharacterized protein n=1 Tax=Sinosporangium siamense TaxID=1367973 RepID=A0A919RH48_9ACTN|nr:hypothetical protein Ssi02_39790 [Sinosporangium siamense]
MSVDEGEPYLTGGDTCGYVSGQHEFPQNGAGQSKAGHPGVQSHPTGSVVVQYEVQVVSQQGTRKMIFGHEG